MDIRGEITEIEIKCSMVIEILSEVIQSHILKENSKQ